MVFCGVRIILVWHKERINLSKKRKTFDKRTKSVYTDLAKSEEDAEKHTPLRANKKKKRKKRHAPLAQLDRALVYGANVL